MGCICCLWLRIKQPEKVFIPVCMYAGIVLLLADPGEFKQSSITDSGCPNVRYQVGGWPDRLGDFSVDKALLHNSRFGSASASEN